MQTDEKAKVGLISDEINFKHRAMCRYELSNPFQLKLAVENSFINPFPSFSLSFSVNSFSKFLIFFSPFPKKCETLRNFLLGYNLISFF